MKLLKNVSKVLLVIVVALTLTGCRRYKQTIDSVNYKIDIKTLNKYEFNYDSSSFRTAREEVIISGDNFKIGIENPIKIKSSKDFDNFKKEYTGREEYKDVKYSGYKGFIFYTPSYIRYEMYLNINNKYVLRLNIYSIKVAKKYQKEALNSKGVQDILEHMKVKVK